MKNSHPTIDFSEWGKAAAIPGFQLAIEHLQAVLDGLRASLAAAQAGGAKKRGRPKGLSPQAAYWAKMTPAERSAEMKRRGMVGKRKAKAAAPGVDVDRLHPRDPRSPRHEAFRKKLSRAVRAAAAKRRKDGTAREAVTEARAARANGAAA